jgi:hypothetical protein
MAIDRLFNKAARLSSCHSASAAPLCDSHVAGYNGNCDSDTVYEASAPPFRSGQKSSLTEMKCHGKQCMCSRCRSAQSKSLRSSNFVLHCRELQCSPHMYQSGAIDVCLGRFLRMVALRQRALSQACVWWKILQESRPRSPPCSRQSLSPV